MPIAEVNNVVWTPTITSNCNDFDCICITLTMTAGSKVAGGVARNSQSVVTFFCISLAFILLCCHVIISTSEDCVLWGVFILTHVGVTARALDPALEHACNSWLTRGGETDLYCVPRCNDKNAIKATPPLCCTTPLRSVMYVWSVLACFG